MGELFVKWLKDRGKDFDLLTEEELAPLKAQYDPLKAQYVREVIQKEIDEKHSRILSPTSVVTPSGLRYQHGDGTFTYHSREEIEHYQNSFRVDIEGAQQNIDRCQITLDAVDVEVVKQTKEKR